MLEDFQIKNVSVQITTPTIMFITLLALNTYLLWSELVRLYPIPPGHFAPAFIKASLALGDNHSSPCL